MDAQRFINALKEALEIQDREVLITDDFRHYSEWDSLAQLTLIAMLDEEFEVSLEMKLFKELVTVGDLFEAVKSAQNE